MKIVTKTKNAKNLVKNYLEENDWQVKENSNMSFSLQGLNNYVSSEISKDYWLDAIYDEDIANAHRGGDFHIHDLGLISVYCVGWDLLDLLQEGFRGVSGKIEAKPPKHFRSALGQAVNFLYTLTGESAGAQAFSNFDTLLAPFIRYDDLSYDQVKQCIQEFIFNINVPTRVGFQTPFTNLTFDLQPPSYLKGQGVLIGGKIQSDKYGDFQEEMNMINRAFLEVMYEGDAKGRVFTFPIPTYNITKDFNWEDPNLDLLWRVTAKYGLPYFANYVNSDMNPEDARSMCCRLRIDNRKLVSRGGGLFGSSPLTGSIGVVTINMPRIGFLAKSRAGFKKHLGYLMDLAKDSLEAKRQILEEYMDNGLYPYAKHYLRNMKKRHGSYWKNHFSTVGLVGMNEACLNFIGEDISSDKGKKFTLEIMDFMRERLLKYQEETGNNYNLEATPAEGTSYRLARMDAKQYSRIKFANQSEYKKGGDPFYTNSTQLPVNFTDDIFEVLDRQDDLQVKYTGGTVVHLFLGEKVNDTESLKNLIKKICQNYRLPYFSITPTFSICPQCGYLTGEVKICRQCQSECEVYSRIVGYLRPVKQWNKGKVAEYEIRKSLRMDI